MLNIAARTAKNFSFEEWLEGLASVSIRLLPDWDEDLRRQFYEGSPSAWRHFYAEGCTPEYAVRHDMRDWSDQ